MSKEISPGISLEGMMLKLKLQYFGHLKRRVDSLEKTLMLGGIRAGGERDDRGWDGWMASRTRCVWVNSGRWWWTGRPGVLWFMGSQRVGHNWATEMKWTELNWTWIESLNVFIVVLYIIIEPDLEVTQKFPSVFRITSWNSLFEGAVVLDLSCLLY